VVSWQYCLISILSGRSSMIDGSVLSLRSTYGRVTVRSRCAGSVSPWRSTGIAYRARNCSPEPSIPGLRKSMIDPQLGQPVLDGSSGQGDPVARAQPFRPLSRSATGCS